MIGIVYLHQGETSGTLRASSSLHYFPFGILPSNGSVQYSFKMFNHSIQTWAPSKDVSFWWDTDPELFNLSCTVQLVCCQKPVPLVTWLLHGSKSQVRHRLQIGQSILLGTMIYPILLMRNVLRRERSSFQAHSSGTRDIYCWRLMGLS
jgi:hypothetical protein